MTEECPKHFFEPYERGTGFWQKRECPGDGWTIQGSIEICRSCGMMRLNPDNKEFTTVDCEEIQNPKKENS